MCNPIEVIHAVTAIKFICISRKLACRLRNSSSHDGRIFLSLKKRQPRALIIDETFIQKVWKTLNVKLSILLSSYSHDCKKEDFYFYRNQRKIWRCEVIKWRWRVTFYIRHDAIFVERKITFTCIISYYCRRGKVDNVVPGLIFNSIRIVVLFRS